MIHQTFFNRACAEIDQLAHDLAKSPFSDLDYGLERLYALAAQIAEKGIEVAWLELDELENEHQRKSQRSFETSWKAPRKSGVQLRQEMLLKEFLPWAIEQLRGVNFEKRPRWYDGRLIW